MREIHQTDRGQWVDRQLPALGNSVLSTLMNELEEGLTASSSMWREICADLDADSYDTIDSAFQEEIEGSPLVEGIFELVASLRPAFGELLDSYKAVMERIRLGAHEYKSQDAQTFFMWSQEISQSLQGIAQKVGEHRAGVPVSLNISMQIGVEDSE